MTTFKKVMQLSLMLLVAYTASYAQNKNESAATGIYQNENDFLNRKLSYQEDGSLVKRHIRAGDLFNPSKVYIGKGKNKISIPKESVFGYRDSNKKDYRFYHNKAYEIIDTRSFFIYLHGGIPQYTKREGYTTIKEYYFSAGPNDPIRKLTVKNLIDAFPSDIAFHYSLENYTGNEKRLMEYDRYAKCFKVKYLYMQSAKL